MIEKKVCPRCKSKVLKSQQKCDNCGLIFSRLDLATNTAAKKEILSHHKENVVYVRYIPKDVNRLKLIFLCGFLGLFGAHNFYIGRYIKAFFSLVVGLISAVLASINNHTDFYYAFMSFFCVCVSIITYFWVSDFIEICVNKYKVPVALERVE